MEIKTNHHWRLLMDWSELTDEEQNEFDWDGADEDSFFRYCGSVYNLGNFMRIREGDPLYSLNWDGSCGNSYWSGLLIKCSPCGSAVIVGRYLS